MIRPHGIPGPDLDPQGRKPPTTVVEFDSHQIKAAITDAAKDRLASYGVDLRAIDLSAVLVSDDGHSAKVMFAFKSPE